MGQVVKVSSKASWVHMFKTFNVDGGFYGHMGLIH
jgi:hypothetical protein